MSTALWRWRDLGLALGLEPAEGPDVKGLAIDSRRVVPGDLFIALAGDPGARFQTTRSDRDGHDFVAAAFAAGAAGALVHRDGSWPGPVLRVGDTIDGLWALGRARRTGFSGRVAAVTGSSGKTTAKTLLAAALDAFATSGSLNNHLGVPLSLASTPIDAHHAVYEIGTNHPGEIAPLSRLASPHVAMVLNVHPAHAEFFADREALLREKLSIHEGLTGSGPLVVEESLDTSSLPPGRPVFRFGEGAGADCRLIAFEGTTARYRLAGRELVARIPGGGRHRALTLGAVLAAVHLLGEDPRCALELADGLIPRGRGTELAIGALTLIDDSYNANPASMAAALDELARRPLASPGRRIAVLGDMLELGERTAEHHRSLAARCAGLDLVVCVGTHMLELYDALAGGPPHESFEAADAALIDWLAAAVAPGDRVLVKGSNRMFWAHDFVTTLAARLRGASA